MKEEKDSDVATATILAELDKLLVEAEQTAAAIEQRETKTAVFMIDLAQLVQSVRERLEPTEGKHERHS
jgi:hypothetical protein